MIAGQILDDCLIIDQFRETIKEFVVETLKNKYGLTWKNHLKIDEVNPGD